MIGKMFALGCLSTMLLTFTLPLQAGIPKSADQVKATATATKIDSKGMQSVTITLDIVKGWHLYANPVNATEENLEAARTRVKVTAKEKVIANPNYPAGKTKIEDKTKYDIYQGKVAIQVNVQRTAGDTSPLAIVIDVSACNGSVCLTPSKITLQVP